MTRPTIRILLPPRPATDSYRDSTSGPRSAYISHRPSSSIGGSSSGSVNARSSSHSPNIIIRTRPSYKEDKRWQDVRHSDSRSGVQSPRLATSPHSYNYGPSWYPQEYERQRPSSALETRRPAYSSDQHYYPPTSPRNGLPPARSSVSSASSASSAHSRRSSSSSDYLYGEDFAYGAEPLQLQSRSRPSRKTPAGVAVTPDQIAEQRRPRVRFVMH